MNYKVFSLNNAMKWKEYLQKIPLNQQDIYYTPEYYRLYEKLGDGNANCFVFQKEDELALYPFLKNSVNDLGYELDELYFDIQGAYGYNGVISSSYSKNFIKEFYKEFNEYCISNKIIAEFTRFHPLINNAFFSKGNMETLFDRKTVFVDLHKDYNDISKGYQRTTKKQIKRAKERFGIDVKVIENDQNIVETFYPVYLESMDRVNSQKYLYYNETYFQDLLSNVNTVCFLAYIDSKLISAIIAIHNLEYIHGHLGGTLNEYKVLSPFSVLYNEMIVYAKNAGFKYLHVGGGATSDIDDPVLKYKLHFSNNVADFIIGKKIHNKQAFKSVRTQWRDKYPDSFKSHQNKLLGYREVPTNGN